MDVVIALALIVLLFAVLGSGLWIGLSLLAVALLGMAHRHLGASLTGFEVMGQFALSLVASHYPQMRVPLYEQAPYCVLLEASDNESEAHARSRFEALLEAAFEDGCVSDAVIAENIAQAHQLWHIRESITMAQAEEGLNIKHDISIPVSRIPAFVAETDALLEREIPGVRMVDFGHLGDGNLHYNVSYTRPGNVDLFDDEPAVNALVYDLVYAHGGTLSAEHGIGQLKRDWLRRYLPPANLAAMRAINTQGPSVALLGKKLQALNAPTAVY